MSVALGLAAIRDCHWAADIGQGLHAVTIRVMDVSAEHTVKFIDFDKWVEGSYGTNFRDMAKLERVREILGLPKTK